MLDLHKDDFCKIVDTIGIDKITEKKGYYIKALRAIDELRQKERYEKAKMRLNELEREKEELEKIVKSFNIY